MSHSANRSWLRALKLLPLLVAVTAVAPASAQDSVVSVGFSVRVVSGTFGSEQTTRLVYAPAVLRVDAGRFEIAGYFPYLTIDNGTVAPNQGGFVPMRGSLVDAPAAGIPMGAGGSMGGMMGSGPSGVTGSSSAVPGSAPLTGQSGLGDIVASVGYRVVENARSGLQVVVSSRVKVPTAAASRGLGTGRVDVGGVGTVRKQFPTGWLYGEGGYLALGDPDGVDLQNAVLWGVGGGRRLTNRVYLLASAYGNSAILPEFGAPVEAGAGLGVRVGRRASLAVVPTIGFSDASPRYAVTISLTSDLVRR